MNQTLQNSNSNRDDYARLLWRSALALVVCTLLVVVCYFWIDRAVAFFVYDEHINTIAAFKWLTYPPPTVQTWSPLVLTLIMICRARGPLPLCLKTLAVACLSLIVADEFRTSLGSLFGRYWPETWFNNNPSLIGTGTYGFHPFQSGDDIGSFPSGHAARILGFAAVWWVSMPRTRPLLILVCVPMLVSVVAMNYHFVSDVIAGSFVGSIIAAYAVRFAGLGKSSDPLIPKTIDESSR